MKKFGVRTGFCYIVCVDNGFYMEPDIEIKKVFYSFKKAKEYSFYLKKNNRCVFIEKRGLYS